MDDIDQEDNDLDMRDPTPDPDELDEDIVELERRRGA
jgi:suppressor of tumorigenicity protein 13